MGKKTSMLDTKIKQDGTIRDTLTGYDFRIDKPLTPIKAIRAKCKECNGTSSEIRDCEMTDCTLWPYRLGHRAEGTGKRREMTEEQRAKAGERLAKARAAKKGE